MLLGVSSVLLAVDRNFAIALGLMVLIGFGSILMAATGNTTIQLAVPDQLRGRVMSVYTTAFSVSVPLGGLTMGAVASAAGVPFAIALGGALSLLIGVAALAWGRRHSLEIVPGGSVGAATRRDHAGRRAHPLRRVGDGQGGRFAPSMTFTLT